MPNSFSDPAAHTFPEAWRFKPGNVIDFDHKDFAGAPVRILQDREPRDRLFRNARTREERDCGQAAVEAAFTSEWQAAWNEEP